MDIANHIHSHTDVSFPITNEMEFTANIASYIRPHRQFAIQNRPHVKRTVHPVRIVVVSTGQRP